MNNEQVINKLTLPLLLVSLPLTVMDVLLPMYTTKLGFTPIQITGMFSVFSLFLVIMRLFIGKLIDSKGSKSIFIKGIMFYALSYFFYALSYKITYLYIARVLQSIAGICVNISTFSMITDLNKDHGYNFGKIQSYAEKGGLIGIAMCFFILNTATFKEGWTRLFAICAVASVVAAVYSFINVKDIKSNFIVPTKFDLSIFKQKIILFNLVIRIFTSIISSIFVLYLARKFNSNLLEIGIAFLLPTIVIAFISPMLGKSSDNSGRYKSIKKSFCMLLLSLILLPIMSNIYLFGVVWTNYCIAITLFDVTLNSMFTSDIVEARGIAISKYTIGANIGNIIGPIAGGLLFQYDIASPFIFSAAAFAILFLTISKWFPLLANENV